ncbi:MAG: aminoglycoside phosphotransferase, partial [Bacteroidota bacterium]
MTTKIQLSLDSTPEEIASYLLHNNILTKAPNNVSIEKPGEGNMNLVLRFRYDGDSLILKQSKPYVNKYPDIPAPEERIDTEAKYYAYASQIEGLSSTMPQILHYDAANHLIVMEDLGASSDFMFCYEKDQQLSDTNIEQLLQYLSALHSHEWTATQLAGFPDNLKLRQVNHAHIFDLPFRSDNGFPLDDMQQGLAQLAHPYTQDEALKTATQHLGEIYLSSGLALLHGDFYPSASNCRDR